MTERQLTELTAVQLENFRRLWTPAEPSVFDDPDWVDADRASWDRRKHLAEKTTGPARSIFMGSETGQAREEQP